MPKIPIKPMFLEDFDIMDCFISNLLTVKRRSCNFH